MASKMNVMAAKMGAGKVRYRQLTTVTRLLWVTVVHRKLTITYRIPESVRARRRHDDNPAANGQDHRFLREAAESLHRNEEGTAVEFATGDLW